MEDATAQATFAACIKAELIADGSFHAVYVPGGHGTMWDLPTSPDVARLIGRAYDAQLPIGAVCHGPAALVAARTINGEPIVKGHTMSCFTNAEEDAVGLTAVVPFLLQTRMSELGATHSPAANFTAHAVVSHNLVTGQNPQSTERVAHELLKVMQARLVSAGNVVGAGD
jgi:putative intracellular protease/amidase